VNRKGPRVRLPLRVSRITYPVDVAKVIEQADTPSNERDASIIVEVTMGSKGLLVLIVGTCITAYYWIALLWNLFFWVSHNIVYQVDAASQSLFVWMIERIAS